ncbi:MAG TPA: PH domain-containing protein [Actinomycetota bacterium]|nr:PH domain-containing protein [Actinomycetota bacterium]
MELQPLDPNVRKLWQVVGVLLVIPPLAAVLIAGTVLELPFALSAAACALLLLPAVTVPKLAYRRWRYSIRERDLYISKGAIWHVETLVPFDRIQFVESRQGPLDRAFDLTQVVIYTAAGKAAGIPGLDQATAEAIREDLSKVAGTASV